MPLAIRRVQIAKLKQEGRRRLLVDMADIRRHDEKLEKAVRMAPTEYIGAFEEALTDAIKNEDPTYFKDPSLTNAPPSDRRMVRARMWASWASSTA